MRPTSLQQIAAWAGGSLIQGQPSATITTVSTDTRSLAPGDLFLAIKGEKFDGHDFIEKAAEQGVAAIFVNQLKLSTERFDGGIIHVRDTLVALRELALRYRRSRLDLFAVGVTGSNGKTSTKDFLTAVLSRVGNVNATAGNLNNHIGLPLTILRTGDEHDLGVWEMGMNHPGEIEVLAEIASPDAAVITNIGTAHIEHMKTREAIALEKGMLAEAVGAEGFVVLPAADDFTPSIAARCRGKVITAGIGCGEIQAGQLRNEGNGMAFLLTAGGRSVEARIPVPGRHMVGNALLAAAVGIERGLSLSDVADALAGVRLSGSRLQRRQVNGIDFLDDSYNANPDSMRAALRTLAELDAKGRKVAVLGRMGELGELEAAEHRSLGEFSASTGIDLLITVGEAGNGIADGAGGKVETIRAADQTEAASRLSDWLRAGDLVLVKGSRSSAMEKVIEALGGESAGH
jgi:UDP-N-acetylmuramoyl-tripeptide--D-alanyl-D-alanine ligase